MSSISCPYCRHVMELKGAKPGRFRPACPACRAQFQLTISSEKGVAPEVEALGVGTTTAESAPPSHASAMQGSAGAATVVAAPKRATSSSDGAGENGAVAGGLKKDGRQKGVTDGDIPVGLADRTVEQLTRQPVVPKWEAAEAAAGHIKLGGYEIIKTLGEGGMGKVYLANQTSLARNVALKVLTPRLASDVQFVARFTREAFAAAQLTHHNVVQIHDIGVERAKNAAETNFFSMEYVQGQSLGNLVANAGKLDPETAVGYVLQAARGLKFAHDHGLVHRDVKPDNLLLNAQGVVKVADLGLVKRSGVSETIAAAAATLSPEQAIAATAGKTLPSAVMGTPAYMPPEQAVDAGTVDARADVYSLGCTLYHLLTGRAPFGGMSIEAILAAHAREAVIPPDRVVKNVPANLSKIVVKMLAKKPDDRYADMGQVIAELERCLGIEPEAAFTPPREQLKLLEMSAERFNSCGSKALRIGLIRAFIIAMPVAIVVLAGIGYPLIAAGVLGYALTTVVSYQLIFGLARQTFLMSKIRQMVFGSTFADWATYTMFAVLAVGLLIAFGLQWIWLGFSVAGLLTALGFYGIVDNQLASDRMVCLDQTEKMLKSLRMQGVDENAVRHFVCRFCGKDWEEFYEALFGFESKLAARAKWSRGELGRARPRHGAWREPLIAWIDGRSTAQREETQRKLISRLESEALQAKGMEPYEANIQARQSANRLMDNAAAVRALALKRSADVRLADGSGAAARSAANAEVIPNDWMFDGTQYKARRRAGGSYLQRRYGTPMDIAVGRGVRLVTGMLILIGFGLWWSNNGASDTRNAAAQLVQAREDAAVTVAEGAMHAVKVNKVFHFSAVGSEPLRINHVPDWLCDVMGCWNGGIAGALLLFSVFFGGRVMGIATIVAASIALLGRRLPIGAVADYEWLVPASAVGVWLIGVLFLRDSTDD